MKKLLSIILIALAAASVQAQELKCQVTVNGQRINGVDPQVFTTLQTQLTDFMNSKAWTQDVFAAEERIECSFFINITKSPEQDVYEAQVTVQSSRPVYNSGYNTTVMNYIDNDWVFTYAQNQPIEYSGTQYINSLSSLIGYYAYLIIAWDYESFGKAGGAKYFQIAETIMNNVPNNNKESKGWRPYDGVRNRYWIINHIMGNKYEGFKQVLYEYHMQGMDNFYEKPAAARVSILSALDKLQKIAADNPNSVLLAIFFQGKSDELIGIFSGADMSEKTKAVQVLKKCDPSNAAKYDKIIRG